MNIWGFYFIVKVALYYMGVIHFHFTLNILFALFLIFSDQNIWLRKIKPFIAIPLGIALLYHDSPLPPIDAVLAKVSQFTGFSAQYLLELITRIITWQELVVLIFAYGVYHVIKKYLRITTLVFLAMMLTLIPVSKNNNALTIANAGDVSDTPSDAELSQSLSSFYQEEEGRLAFTQSKKQTPAPYDVIFISVCSLSWDDIEYLGMSNNNLFNNFDIVFKNFNSASSYSGPSIIRLLRASKGQEKQKNLYNPADPNAYLFNHLSNSGFSNQFAMNHNGVFGGLINEIRNDGNLRSPLLSNEGLPQYIRAFDGTAVNRDYDVLSRWWGQRLQSPDRQVSLFYNTISLHDGNKLIDGRFKNSVESYGARLQALLDDVWRFYQLINDSKRNAVIVFIPEHGAAIRREKNQITGLREIPSPLITNIPVGIISTKKADLAGKAPVTISEPTSYLALSALVSKLIASNVFDSKQNEISGLAQNLPTTRFVSENEDLVIMNYGKNYFMHSNDIDWTPFTFSK